MLYFPTRKFHHTSHTSRPRPSRTRHPRREAALSTKRNTCTTNAHHFQISPLAPHFHTVTKTFTQISNLVPHISNSIWRSKFNLEGGGWGGGGGVVRFMDDSSTSITSFTTFTRMSPHLPAVSPHLPAKITTFTQISPIFPHFHTFSPLLPKIYPQTHTFTLICHTSHPTPNHDILIEISLLKTFTQCVVGPISKFNYESVPDLGYLIN